MFKNAECYFQNDIVSIGMNNVQELMINLVDNPYNQMINSSADQNIDLYVYNSDSDWWWTGSFLPDSHLKQINKSFLGLDFLPSLPLFPKLVIQTKVIRRKLYNLL